MKHKIYHIENNEIVFLPSGVDSYAIRWQLLENAKSTIHLVTFSFMKDKTTRKLVDLLIKKAKEGISIRIIYDEIVNQTTFVGPWIKELESNGIETFGYNSLSDNWNINLTKGSPFKQLIMTLKLKLKQHFHEKYFIVDNQHLILGGINWGDKYAFGGLEPKAWRDTDIYIKGQVLPSVQLQFIKDYTKLKAWKNTKSNYQNFTEFSIKYLHTYLNDDHHIRLFPTLLNSKFDNKLVKYMAHKPYDTNTLELTNEILHQIQKAKSRIFWGCHGIRPPKIYTEYLANAVSRGVEVVLITNSAHSSKTLMVNGLLGWMYLECTRHYKQLLKNGIKIFEWQKPGAFHSKNLVIDDNFVSIGSYNIANGSTFHHSESNIIIYDKEFNASVFNQFEIDLQSCKQIDLKTFKEPKIDAFFRIIHERYKLINQNLLTPQIKLDLQNNNYKQFPLYEFIDIS